MVMPAFNKTLLREIKKDKLNGSKACQSKRSLTYGGRLAKRGTDGSLMARSSTSWALQLNTSVVVTSFPVQQWNNNAYLFISCRTTFHS